MSRYVMIAALQFDEIDRERAGASDVVRRQTQEQLDALAGLDLDLVVTSEGVAAVGQTMDTAEDPAAPGPIIGMYRDFARREHCVVAGSVRTRQGARVFNSIVFINADGGLAGVYHKANLTLGEIDRGMTSGLGAVVVATDVGRLGGAICFDLNFEWLRRQYEAEKPDIMVFASLFHGGLQQQWWAYRCRCYFVSALQFAGCGILDPFGRPRRLTDCYTRIARARVNLDRVMVHLDNNSARFPEIERTYGRDVRIDVPANIGAALITSESARVTAADVARRFELELLDDYFARASRANATNR